MSNSAVTTKALIIEDDPALEPGPPRRLLRHGADQHHDRDPRNDLSSEQVELAGSEVHLTGTEFALLSELAVNMAQPGRALRISLAAVGLLLAVGNDTASS